MPRSTVPPVTRASDVPVSGSSSAVVETLSPVPTTTAAPLDSRRGSRPACGRRAASRSLGHFSEGRTPVTSATDSASATPVSSGSQPLRAAGTSGRSRKETVSPARGGEVQTRSSRPRPADLVLGDEHRALRRAAVLRVAARPTSAALVEPISSTTSSERHSPLSRVSAAARAGPSSAGTVQIRPAGGGGFGHSPTLRPVIERARSRTGTAWPRTRPTSASEEDT